MCIEFSPSITVPHCKLSSLCCKSLQLRCFGAEGDGQRLTLTPDLLADIYQCNITYLDDSRIQALNVNLR